MPNNKDDIEKVQLRKRAFVEVLIHDMEQPVAGMLYTMTNDRALVEDVLIATWETACQKMEQIEKYENLHGWVMKMAKFKMLKALEKRQHISEHEMYVLDKLENYIAEEQRIETGIMDILKKYLKEEDQKAVVLKYFYGVSYPELADYFHCREATIRKRVNRAIKKLRKDLERDGISEYELSYDMIN